MRLPRYLTVAPYLSAPDLAQRYRRARDPVERTHWQVLWLVSQGFHCPADQRTRG